MTTPEGPLYESNAIAYYVASSTPNSPIMGKTAYENARILNFLFYFDNELVSSVYQWFLPVIGYFAYDAAKVEVAKNTIVDKLAILESELSTKTFLVGDRITLADICGVCSLLPLFSECMGPELRKKFVSVVRWYETCINQKNFKDCIGNVSMVAKTPTQAKVVKPVETAKAECPAKCPAKSSSNDDDLDAPKPKSAMDLLPPSPLNLDEWKRVYSNKDTRKEAIPWFWEHYDPEGYSMYFLDYKYNEELTKQFMVSNLIGGFFRRMESLHRYAFGSMLILGTENNFKVQGVMMFRGREIPQEMKDVGDFESYSFTQLNHLDEKDKKTWNDFIAWDGDFAAGKVATGSIFK